MAVLPTPLSFAQKNDCIALLNGEGNIGCLYMWVDFTVELFYNRGSKQQGKTEIEAYREIGGQGATHNKMVLIAAIVLVLV